MNRLLAAYRGLHEQGFVPIFARDEFDSKTLVEACVAAGARGIEYTLRRSDAREMIPWIRRHHPDLFLLVGSTLDSERIVRKLKRRHPQLMTVQEAADLGVDGFVSMLGWSSGSIARYAGTHIVIPTAMTVTEALQQMDAGAHFVKCFGSDLAFIERLRLAPTFDFCPVFATGGMTPQRIPVAVRAGAVVVASGFDLILDGCPADVNVKDVAAALSVYLDVTHSIREAVWPEMMACVGADTKTWLDALPHYHPF